MKYYKITLQRYSYEYETYYVAQVPELDGCVSDGDTIKEALYNIKDAMDGWIQVCKEEGIFYPEPQYETQVVEYLGDFSEEEINRIQDSVEKFREVLAEIEGRNRFTVIKGGLEDYKN